MAKEVLYRYENAFVAGDIPELRSWGSNLEAGTTLDMCNE